MAVLVEGISVVIRLDAVDRVVPGGRAALEALIPNATYCSDGELARVGFLSPADTEAFVDELKVRGLKFIVDGKCKDIAVVDQQRGLTMPCDWLEFAHLRMGDGKVGACWLFEGPRIAAGLHMKCTSIELATPAGWEYAGSLSQKFAFVPGEPS